MSSYKTYKKEKRLYLAFSIVAYFLPFIVATVCLLPFIKVAEGFKIAIGVGVVVINAIPFLMGVFRTFFAHFPMFNMLAVVFISLATFFRLDVFKNYADIFLWIELSAALGSVVSCILWAQYRKFSEYSRTMTATVHSKAFNMKEEDNDK
jgi:hypothetical protein